MPSFEHEFPLDLIRNDPGFAAELLREVSGKPLPEHTRVRCGAAEATSTALQYLDSDNRAMADREQLRVWVRRAATVERAEDLFR
jgi:hypothetical protein